MRNVCNVGLPQVIGDVISGIGISISTAAADTIGYRAPARYWSNPSFNLPVGDDVTMCSVIFVNENENENDEK